MKYRHHKRQKKPKAGKSLIPERVSIHDRPAEADGHRFGDWEMDLVVGKGQTSVIKKHVHTITTDNGVEFRDHQWLAKMLGTKVYFADPYCSGPKSAVENANKLLRQYFPKGTDFREVSQEKLNQVQYKINRRPREKLGFISPKVAFFNAIH